LKQSWNRQKFLNSSRALFSSLPLFSHNSLGDGVRLGHAPRADHAAGQLARPRLDYAHAALAEGFEVGLRRRMLPHIHVHRGRHEDRRGGGQVEGGEKIVGDAVGEFGQDVGRGRSDNQRRSRLHLLANNARFCLLSAAGEFPNLASKVMALNLARLSEDWQQAYGHPILLVESFVDPQLFRGTAYKASGWKMLGCTSGFKRVAQDFYQAHDRPKELYVREIVKRASCKLRARYLPQELKEYERKIVPKCQMPGKDLQSFWQAMHKQVPEGRRAKGMRHKQATVLTITFAFLLSGGQGGHRAVVSFARDLTPTQRDSVGCWFNERTRTYDPPSENAVYRVLKAVPVMEFQQAVWSWQKALHGS